VHIVHVITRLIVGGAQENTLLSCEGQHALGHEVTLLTGPSEGPEGSLMARAEAAGYRVEVVEPLVRNLQPRQDWAAYRQLTGRLRELRPDVVHTHSSKAGIIGRYAARAAGVPGVVHTIHGLAFTAGGRLANAAFALAERRAAPLTDRIVCVADAMAEQSLARGIGKPGQYVTVHSGMDVEPFLEPPVPREAVRQQLGLEPQHVAVGTIARLFDLKGHDDFLHLAPDLCRRLPELRFVWIGDGSLRPRLERDVAALGLADRFILTGLVPPGRIPELANALDILAHPSRREGLARALPQGALAGCPVIGYAIDGNAEGLIEGETGHAVPPFDVETFGRHIRELAEDPDRRRAMGAAGRAFAAERFSTETMVRRLEDVYAEVHSTPKHKPATSRGRGLAGREKDAPSRALGPSER
jgi:glycosyltransferase involved in cell wall biosynthesis